MNNVSTLLLACGPQPEGGAAALICPPGARAKVQTLFIDRPLGPSTPDQGSVPSQQAPLARLQL
jgi:hypothetical protein